MRKLVTALRSHCFDFSSRIKARSTPTDPNTQTYQCAISGGAGGRFGGAGRLLGANEEFRTARGPTRPRLGPPSAPHTTSKTPSAHHCVVLLSLPFTPMRQAQSLQIGHLSPDFQMVLLIMVKVVSDYS